MTFREWLRVNVSLCRCHEAYRDRRMTDPDCQHCATKSAFEECWNFSRKQSHNAALEQAADVAKDFIDGERIAKYIRELKAQED